MKCPKGHPMTTNVITHETYCPTCPPPKPTPAALVAQGEDIVERCHEWARLMPPVGPHSVSGTLDEAAREITRLRQQAEADRREVEGLRAKLDREERDHERTVCERDDREQMLDRLVENLGGTALHGEHSNLNCPWTSALLLAAANHENVGKLAAALTAARQRVGVLEGAMRAVREMVPFVVSMQGRACAWGPKLLPTEYAIRDVIDTAIGPPGSTPSSGREDQGAGEGGSRP